MLSGCTGKKLLTYRVLSSQPLPPGQKRKKEAWENVWYVGMYGTMAVAAVLLYYKPDTRCVNTFTFFTHQLIVAAASRAGLWKRPRHGWRHEARSLDTANPFYFQYTNTPTTLLSLRPLTNKHLEIWT